MRGRAGSEDQPQSIWTRANYTRDLKVRQFLAPALLKRTITSTLDGLVDAVADVGAGVASEPISVSRWLKLSNKHLIAQSAENRRG